MKPSIIISCCALFITLIISSFTPNLLEEELRIRVEQLSSGNYFESPEKLHCSKSIPSFYQKNNFHFVWTTKNLLKELIEALEKANEEGLIPEDYHLTYLKKTTATTVELSKVEQVQLELIASDGFLLFLSHLQSGKVNPVLLDPEFFISRREGNPINTLERVSSKTRISTFIAEALPKHKIYLDLKTALIRLNNIKQQGAWKPIEITEKIGLGMKSSKVTELKNRLMISGDYPFNASPSLEFDEDLKTALIKFQTRHGLKGDGKIGKETLQALNITVDEKINKTIVNLERWRWFPQEFGSYYVKVNIANFNLDVVKNNKVVRQHKVIVGKDSRKTPVFSSKLSYIVFNPTWTVPPGILRKDMIPALKKNPNYLSTKNISVFDNAGKQLNPIEINWNESSVYSYTYRQPAGPENALGAVKFIFPNNFNIYLHDTPSRDLFDQQDRSFSSGCVRVHQPLDLAQYLINDSLRWSSIQIQQVIKSQETKTVFPTQKPEIHIMYWTTWTNSEGFLQFRKDVYKRDDVVLKALRATPNS